MHFDKDEIKQAARGRELDIYENVCGLSTDILDGKHHPCPNCGGADRFRVMVEKEDRPLFCNQECFGKKTVDVIGAVEQFRGVSFDEACSLIGEYLGLTERGTLPAKRKQTQIPETKRGAKPSAVYDYTDRDGNPAYRVERYELTKDGKKVKEFRQKTLLNGEWKPGIFDTPGAIIGTPKRIPYPYQFRRLMGEGVKIVFIVEGEKCVERLQAVLDSVEQYEQFAVTTLAGGSNSMRYWGDHAQELDGLKVYIIPDNDKPGKDGSSAAVEGLDGNGIEVSVIPFEEKPENYDIADWIDEQRAAGLTDSEIGKAFLKTLPAKAVGGIKWVDGLDDEKGKTENKPDFLEYLPGFFNDYCEEVGRHFGFDGAAPAYVGLSVASVAMAHRTVFTYGKLYAKSALLHTLFVAPSGTGKSPIIQDYMLLPFREICDQNYNQMMDLYYQQVERAATEKEKKNLAKETPRIIQNLIEQPTTEAVLMTFDLIEKASREGEQKRGVCLFYDEGKQLIEGLDAYHNKAKNDLSILLSLMDGRGSGAVRVDISRNRYYKDPRLVLIAGVQNSVIKRCVKSKPEYFEEGFFQRVNVIVPDLLPSEYGTQEESEDFTLLKDEYGLRIRQIYHKQYYHKFYTLDRDAKRKYQEYEKEIGATLNGIKAQGVENFSPTDEIRLSLLNKSRQRVLEVALVIQVLNDVENEEEITEANDTKGKITARAIEGAVRFVRHSHREFFKLVELSSENKSEQDLESKIIRVIENAGNKGITRRELRRKYFPGHGQTKADVVGEFMAGLMSRHPGIKERVNPGRGVKSVTYYAEQTA